MSVSRELKRNSGPKGTYNAWYGNCAYLHRRKGYRRTLRIFSDPDLEEFIKSKLSHIGHRSKSCFNGKKGIPVKSLAAATICIVQTAKRVSQNAYPCIATPSSCCTRATADVPTQKRASSALFHTIPRALRAPATANAFYLCILQHALACCARPLRRTAGRK